MGDLVTAGIFWCSCTVDSGYMPFAGRICRNCASLVGLGRFAAAGCERE